MIENGNLMPNNQRQHRTSHAPKDVLPLRICANYCASCQPLLRAFSGWVRSPPPVGLFDTHTPSNPETCFSCRILQQKCYTDTTTPRLESSLLSPRAVYRAVPIPVVKYPANFPISVVKHTSPVVKFRICTVRGRSTAVRV